MAIKIKKVNHLHRYDRCLPINFIILCTFISTHLIATVVATSLASEDLQKDRIDFSILYKNHKDDYYNDGGGKQNDNYHRHRHSLPSWVGNENFILTDHLADGELERRISYNGLTAKETSIGYNSSELLSLWQISDGKRFIQLIYANGEDLIDCEYIHQKNLVRKFLHDFYHEIDLARSKNFSSSYSRLNIDAHNNILMDDDIYDDDDDDVDDDNDEGISSIAPGITSKDSSFGMRNLSYHQINSYEDIPEEIRQFLNYNELRVQCFRRHNQMKEIVQGLNSKDHSKRHDANQLLQRKKRDLSDWLIAPNTKWCGKGHSAGKYNQLGGASTADKCCRKHDHCKLNIPGLTTKWQVFNYFPFTISHCRCDMRHRRDLSNMLRIPGTKWCGKGYSAVKYAELGGYSKADRCCRQHDKSCPFWIMGFETKYGLFNWRISTLMHCKCDERFRTCLKMADSADANMVGKLFFNIVQTKCFVLKTEKVCKKRSWWGKCEKRVRRKRAHLRDNRKY